MNFIVIGCARVWVELCHALFKHEAIAQELEPGPGSKFSTNNSI